MSSMRSRKRPPDRRAMSKFSNAENAWPRWRYPLGLGAKRKTGGGIDFFHQYPGFDIRYTARGDADANVKFTALQVRFRHSHLVSAGTLANVGFKGRWLEFDIRFSNSW